MQLMDTHCHIHSSDYSLDAEEAYQSAIASGLAKMICVGTDEQDSEEAVDFAAGHDHARASVGVHPHEAKTLSSSNLQKIRNLLEREKSVASNSRKIVAIGEIGLDYHYAHSSRNEQITAFEAQLQLALEYNLPVIFHVRQGFDDFWPILANFTAGGHKLRGVLHSFTDTAENAEKAINYGFFIGVNGICTFTKDPAQQEMYKNLPLEKLILETDAPYLTPMPKRGKINEPTYVRLVAEYVATQRGILLSEVAGATTRNATQLFGF